MENTLKLKIKGLVGIKKIYTSGEEEILLEDNNNITDDSLEIIMRCLTQHDFNKSVDRIKVKGDFGEIEQAINFAGYNNGSITFKAIFPEFSFSGLITGLELRSSALNKKLAVKENLSIYKENTNFLLQIDWKITITNN